MTDETEADEPKAPEHVLNIDAVPAMTFGMHRHNSDLLVTCSCGWRTVKARTQRDARRLFERHLRKVATGATDLGDVPLERDSPRAIFERQRGTEAR